MIRFSFINRYCFLAVTIFSTCPLSTLAAPYLTCQKGSGNILIEINGEKLTYTISGDIREPADLDSLPMSGTAAVPHVSAGFWEFVGLCPMGSDCSPARCSNGSKINTCPQIATIVAYYSDPRDPSEIVWKKGEGTYPNDRSKIRCRFADPKKNKNYSADVSGGDDKNNSDITGAP